MTLLEQAVSVADTTGDIEPAVKARSGLARAQLQLGDPAAALAATAARRELPYPTEEPTMRLLEGLALLELHRLEESVRAFSDAVAAADALLALADRNVAALQARALALSGLAAATGDPARAAEAGEAFARAHAVTSAAGVAADTRRLLDQIACHDRSGILAGSAPHEIRDGHQPGLRAAHPGPGRGTASGPGQANRLKPAPPGPCSPPGTGAPPRRTARTSSLV